MPGSTTDLFTNIIMGFFSLLVFASVILTIVSVWRVFEKADRPGWYALIPVWNIYQLVKIAGLSGLSMLLLLIPVVNLIYAIILNIRVAQAFGQSAGFGVGLSLFGVVFWPLLGFGPAEYLPHQREASADRDAGPYRNEDGDWVEEVPLSEW